MPKQGSQLVPLPICRAEWWPHLTRELGWQFCLIWVPSQWATLAMELHPAAKYSLQSYPSRKPGQRAWDDTEPILQPQRPWIVKGILRKKNKGVNITLPGYKPYYKAIVIKTVWYWHKNSHRSMEQNRKPRKKPMHVCQLIYNKGARNIYNRVGKVFS